MRVAVVHDWLSECGGAEKVTRELVRLYDADVFALVDFLKEQDRATILQGRHATTSFIQRLPFARSNFRSYLPLFPAAIQHLDLEPYDLIISSSYAFAKGVRKRTGQHHVCYIHTPMRWAWVNEEGYLRDHHLGSWKAWILKRLLHRLRRWDLTTNQHVDLFIANSQNVAGRVKDIYHRDAQVVLPPVDVDAFTLHSGARDGYLAVSRLVPYKRTDRIIEAFRGLEASRLTIVGHGPEAERLRAMAPANVTFMGEVPRTRLVELMRSAKALICAANEDLGLTVLEAQACGTPVIALRAGGYLETVDIVNGGAFFDRDDPATIREAVLHHELRGTDWSPARLREGILPYSTERFRDNIAAIVRNVIRHA